jgi:hypothetical protein
MLGHVISGYVSFVQVIECYVSLGHDVRLGQGRTC